MSPATLHQRLAELYVDTQTGAGHSHQLTGLLHQAVRLARVEAVQSECAHEPGEPFTQTHAAGRDKVTPCLHCGRPITTEPV